jgi:hypothetical protein
MSDYRLDNRGSIPGTAKGFSSSLLCPDHNWGPPSLLSNLYRGGGDPFYWGKARLGRNVDHSPPSRAEVKNEELYFLSPLAPSWVVGHSFTFFLYFHYRYLSQFDGCWVGGRRRSIVLYEGSQAMLARLSDKYEDIFLSGFGTRRELPAGCL